MGAGTVETATRLRAGGRCPDYEWPPTHYYALPAYADLLIYGESKDAAMSITVRDAGWYTVLDTSGETDVVDEATQSEFCAKECATTHAGSGCQAFSATFSSNSCTLMAANTLIDLEYAAGTNFYFLHPGGRHSANPPGVWAAHASSGSCDTFSAAVLSCGVTPVLLMSRRSFWRSDRASRLARLWQQGLHTH